MYLYINKCCKLYIYDLHVQYGKIQLHSEHFFVFVTAINLVFLYHTMLFHENIIDAYLFTKNKIK